MMNMKICAFRAFLLIIMFVFVSSSNSSMNTSCTRLVLKFHEQCINYTRTVCCDPGWWCDATCTKNVTEMNCSIAYQLVNECCLGYSGEDCLPVCNNTCPINSYCTAPNTCSCLSGWKGINCTEVDNFTTSTILTTDTSGSFSSSIDYCSSIAVPMTTSVTINPDVMITSTTMVMITSSISPGDQITITSTPSSIGHPTSAVPLVTGVLSSVFFLIFVLLCVLSVAVCYCKRRLRTKRRTSHFELRHTNLNSELSWPNANTGSTVPVQQSPYDDSGFYAFPRSRLIESSDLKLIEKIGQGEFGVVYRGVLTKYHNKEPTVIPVAVKTVKSIVRQSQLTDILIEAEKMMHFDHFNVLSLTGICVDLLDSPCLVMPFMSNGSLLSYLRKQSAELTVSESSEENIVLDTRKQLLSMCLQVAKGMAYLTEQKFIHRDLAARNCMISSDGVIKVADFGLAEDVYSSGYFKQNKDSDTVCLPFKWMALESMAFQKFNEKTDVWSYGVLCWEVFTIGKTPYIGMSPKEVVKMLESRERLAKPATPTCDNEIYSLMLSCWDESPDKRPYFTDIVSKIEILLIPLAEYMDFTDCYPADLNDNSKL